MFPRTGLRIYIRRGLEMLEVLCPLTDQLAGFLNLGQMGRELLSKVLTSTRPAQFQESLERAGVNLNFAPQEAEVESSPQDNPENWPPQDDDGSESIVNMLGRLQLEETQAPRLPQHTLERQSAPSLSSLHSPPRSPPSAFQNRSEPVIFHSEDSSPASSSAGWTPRYPSPRTGIVPRSPSSRLTPTPSRPGVVSLGERLSSVSLIDPTPQTSRPDATPEQGSESNPTTSFPLAPPSTTLFGSEALSSSVFNFTPVSLETQSSSINLNVPPQSTSRSAGAQYTSLPYGSRSVLSHTGSSGVTEAGEADSPHEIGFQGEHLVSPMPFAAPLGLLLMWTQAL
jgi:hypothetical protein